ncbi:2,3-bisphosphoglycerate-dependent phosphoglycerate mutase [Candidatus Nomurabacteria bacterium]|nr:2,3-bisphosphoglycerate-dependent phosphoglycerate mutase [Candidatus Saccharibacteria bacterium]MCB9839337.1 2,3-bisphosphoglycerate-dependent phosphoglycerate mutase [Candidatus Nomurabacteria bacterium]
MALIYFYDTTEIDKQQITKGLIETDHHWEFVDEQISTDNLNLETEVLSVFITSAVTAEIINALPKLKLIACRSTGFNNIDLNAAAAKGIAVENVPTYGDQTVAEYAFTLLLALSRKLPEAINSYDKNVPVENMRGWDLKGKTLGVIGSGHIGQCAIKIANGFGMNVIAYDPYPNEQVASELGFKYVELDEVFINSDAITIHAPYFPSNHHIVNAEKLALMKPTAVLVNTARGELVDTKALADAMSQNKIAGVALDVIEGEQLMHLSEDVALIRGIRRPQPDILEHSLELMALHKMPNVILVPHNAFNTVEAIGRINDVTCQNIIKFWYGDVPNLVKQPPKATGKLTIVRHTESEWNATGQWTGITDVHLSDKGFKDAGKLGQLVAEKNLAFDKAYCSEQIRTLETLEGILDGSSQFDVIFERVGAINERDYGEYTGKNKWEVRDLIGEEQFNRVRRGWDEPIPGGETLKVVYKRVVKFYKEVVLPQLLEGQNILLVSHGNGIRSLVKYLESISDQDIEQVEMIFNTLLVYSVDEKGKMVKKEVFSVDNET